MRHDGTTHNLYCLTANWAEITIAAEFLQCVNRMRTVEMGSKLAATEV